MLICENQTRAGTTVFYESDDTRKHDDAHGESSAVMANLLMSPMPSFLRDSRHTLIISAAVVRLLQEMALVCNSTSKRNIHQSDS